MLIFFSKTFNLNVMWSIEWYIFCLTILHLNPSEETGNLERINYPAFTKLATFKFVCILCILKTKNNFALNFEEIDGIFALGVVFLQKNSENYWCPKLKDILPTKISCLYKTVPYKTVQYKTVRKNMAKYKKNSPIQNSPKNSPKKSPKNSPIDRSDNFSRSW